MTLRCWSLCRISFTLTPVGDIIIENNLFRVDVFHGVCAVVHKNICVFSLDMHLYNFNMLNKSINSNHFV